LDAVTFRPREILLGHQEGAKEKFKRAQRHQKSGKIQQM